MLEPVLENYMGPPISYNTPSKPSQRGGRSAKVAPAGAQSKQKRSSNPLSIFGKLRDRYIRTMNELAMGGDFAAVAGSHGCVAGPDYPGSLEYQRSDDRRRELEALREELAALQRVQQNNSQNESDKER